MGGLEKAYAAVLAPGGAGCGVELVGLGSRHPVAGNGNTDGRDRNRRVEIVVRPW